MRSDEARVEAVAAVRDTLIEAADAAVAVAALDVLADERDLAAVARAADLEAVASAALERLSERQDARRRRAAGRAAPKSRWTPSRGVKERDELLSVAVKADDKGAALAACERLLDGGDLDAAALETMSRQARHKGVARRARAVLAARSEDRASEVAAAPGVDLCAALEARASTITSLEEGRKALDDAVQRWAGVDGPIGAAVAERFAAARRALEDRLLALDATAVEAQRAAAERTAAESSRAALCERVEALEGDAALDGLRQARAEWEALAVDPDATDEARAVIEALGARFERAAAACEARHAALERRHEQIAQARRPGGRDRAARRRRGRSGWARAVAGAGRGVAAGDCGGDRRWRTTGSRDDRGAGRAYPAQGGSRRPASRSRGRSEGFARQGAPEESRPRRQAGGRRRGRRSRTRS